MCACVRLNKVGALADKGKIENSRLEITSVRIYIHLESRERVTATAAGTRSALDEQ